MSGDALVTDEYWQITGDAGEGTLMTFSPDPRKNEAASEVVAKFDEKGIVPEGLRPLHLCRDPGLGAGRRGGGLHRLRARHRGARRRPSSRPCSATIGFDDKGDVSAPGYVVYEWSGRVLRLRQLRTADLLERRARLRETGAGFFVSCAAFGARAILSVPMATLLITNGDSAADNLRAAGLPPDGELLPWRDALHWGRGAGP